MTSRSTDAESRSAADRPRWRFETAVWLLAALPRLAYLLAARPPFTNEYWELAGSVRQYGVLGYAGYPTTRSEPLYPLALASLRSVTNDRVFITQILQVVIGSFAAVCIFRLTAALTTSRRTALIAAALFAIYPLSIRHAADGSDQTLMALLLTVVAWRFVVSGTTAGAAAAGIWLGLAILTRAMALPLVPLLAGVLLLHRQPRAAGAFAVAALMIAAPFAVRNYRLNGALLPTRTGINLLVSNSEYTQAVVPTYHADFLESYAESLLRRDGLGSTLPMTPALERSQDLDLRRRAWADMKRRPAEMIWLRAKYAGLFLAPFLVPLRDDSEDTIVRLESGGRVIVDNGMRRPWWMHVVYAVSFTPILILAGTGVYLRRREIRRDAILYAILVTFVGTHAIFFPATRYRLPMDFVLIVFAAVAVEALFVRWSMWSAAATLRFARHRTIPRRPSAARGRRPR